MYAKKCNIKEDTNHAFMECKLNEPLFKHLKEILRDIPSKAIDVQYSTLAQNRL